MVECGSFRDPAGRVRERDGELVREVFQAGRPAYELLRRSGLYGQLVDSGRLISHVEIRVAHPDRADPWLVLRPEHVPFISYAFEWCFSQLRDAALTTLNIQDQALSRGLSLKDAVPENIQFLRGRAVLIDTLSFEGARRVWPAYYQFCRRFLAPLLLTVHAGPRFIRSLAIESDGISLGLASSLLPWLTWLQPTALFHIHLHARGDRRMQALKRRPKDRRLQEGESQVPRPGQAELSRQRALVDSLRRAIDSLRWRPPETDWTRYEREKPTYSGEAWADRERLLQQCLDCVQPTVVWDLGAALGHASRIPAAARAETIAFDSDPSCVELMWRRVKEDKEQHLLPLVQDLLRPTPRMGWGEQELMSLSDRGPADLLLCLGLFHHLNIRGGVPADLVFDYLAKLGRAALVEFIPPSDPIVIEWCRKFGREALKEDEFRSAAEQFYSNVERLPITGSERVLFLCQERRPRN